MKSKDMKEYYEEMTNIKVILNNGFQYSGLIHTIGFDTIKIKDVKLGDITINVSDVSVCYKNG